tara:strand:+ start:1341 stop:1979 length:639 start_codon:yes stop_codon:yes gene_type:complete
MRILATIRFNRSFDQPVSPCQGDGGDAKADQQLGFVFCSFRENDHFPGHGRECSDQNQFDLDNVATQVAGDVLQHFQGNQHRQQIPEDANQAITQPVGILFVGDQRQCNTNGELDDRGRDHNGRDHSEKNRDLFLTRINPLQEASTLGTGLGHWAQLLLNGLKKGLAGVSPGGFSILVLQVIDPSAPSTQSVGTTVLCSPVRLPGPRSQTSD